tara:strand:+ start:14 stop:601 length:588 start_codon:yes stop_codon:yes gene_type:complete
MRGYTMAHNKESFKYQYPDATVETITDAGIEIYKHDLICGAFPVKGKNAIWCYKFKDLEQMQSHIDSLIESKISWKNRVKEERAKRFTPHSLKIGDVLYCSWGYDQTNIDFFKVSKLIGKNKVALIPVSGAYTEQNGAYGNKVVASDECSRNSFITKEKNYMVDGSNNSITISSFANAYLWDGKPLYETDPLFGH